MFHHCRCLHHCCCPAPTYWCSTCCRYTTTLHSHYVPHYVPTWPVHCGPSPTARNSQAINALAGRQR